MTTAIIVFASVISGIILAAVLIKRGSRIPGLLSDLRYNLHRILTRKDIDALIADTHAKTERERKKTRELRRLLEAKQTLAQTRSLNARLRKSLGKKGDEDILSDDILRPRRGSRD